MWTVRLIIFPDVYECVRRVVRGHSMLFVEGIIQQDEGVTNVLAGHGAAAQGFPGAAS